MIGWWEDPKTESTHLTVTAFTPGPQSRIIMPEAKGVEWIVTQESGEIQPVAMTTETVDVISNQVTWVKVEAPPARTPPPPEPIADSTPRPDTPIQAEPEPATPVPPAVATQTPESVPAAGKVRRAKFFWWLGGRFPALDPGGGGTYFLADCRVDGDKMVLDNVRVESGLQFPNPIQVRFELKSKKGPIGADMATCNGTFTIIETYNGPNTQGTYTVRGEVMGGIGANRLDLRSIRATSQQFTGTGVTPSRLAPMPMLHGGIFGPL